jgi:hypothetical protein
MEQSLQQIMECRLDNNAEIITQIAASHKEAEARAEGRQKKSDAEAEACKERMLASG